VPSAHRGPRAAWGLRGRGGPHGAGGRVGGARALWAVCTSVPGRGYPAAGPPPRPRHTAQGQRWPSRGPEGGGAERRVLGTAPARPATAPDAGPTGPSPARASPGWPGYPPPTHAWPLGPRGLLAGPRSMSPAPPARRSCVGPLVPPREAAAVRRALLPRLWPDGAQEEAGAPRERRAGGRARLSNHPAPPPCGLPRRGRQGYVAAPRRPRGAGAGPAGAGRPTPPVRSPASPGPWVASAPAPGCPLPTPAWPPPAGRDAPHSGVAPLATLPRARARTRPCFSDLHSRTGGPNRSAPRRACASRGWTSAGALDHRGSAHQRRVHASARTPSRVA
jgi:hypothetical protein